MEIFQQQFEHFGKQLLGQNVQLNEITDKC